MVENLEINTVSCVQHPVEIDRLDGIISLCHRGRGRGGYLTPKLRLLR